MDQALCIPPNSLIVYRLPCPGAHGVGPLRHRHGLLARMLSLSLLLLRLLLREHRLRQRLHLQVLLRLHGYGRRGGRRGRRGRVADLVDRVGRRGAGVGGHEGFEVALELGAAHRLHLAVGEAAVPVIRAAVKAVKEVHVLLVTQVELLLDHVEGLKGGDGGGEREVLLLDAVVVGDNLVAVVGEGHLELVVRVDENLKRDLLASLLLLARLGKAHELGGGNLQGLDELLKRVDGGLA
mmetsp:Transcript_8218/g.37445  ORF Transcript_8218/g.37445 Transcript_8218/m.37445 type:complete len:238 (-) Transcript_8218:1231-1944(-)